MRQMSLEVLALVLADLLSRRRALLASTEIGRGYLPRLQAHADALARLTEVAARKRRPEKEALAEANAAHDAAVRGVDAALTLLEVTDYSPEAQATVARLRATLLPGTRIIKARHVDKVAWLRGRPEVLRQVTAEVAPLDDGRPTCLPTLLRRWEAAVDALDAALARRAHTLSETSAPSRLELSHLRPKAIGLLSGLRQALQDEVDADPALPRDLVAQIFGYADTLSAPPR